VIRRANLHTIAALTAALAGLLAPTAGLADGTPSSGGTGLSPSGGPAPSSPNRATAHQANAVVSASGDGITVQTSESGLLRRAVTFTGTAPARDAGRVVQIERSTATPNGGASWVPAANATVASNGSFSVRWRASRLGRVAIEAVLLPAGTSADATRRAHQTSAGATAPTGPSTGALTITVYRPAVATFYGPGFWGHRTACGQRLGRTTLGLASRTLPCGTRVAVLYRGRAITVPVIDRGPYARGVTWDLTEATARALGMTGTATVGTIAAR
jgi:rare lipoprotein A